MEGNGNQRRYTRMEVVLPATLNASGGATVLQTLNVSRNGVFLRSAQPLPERHLLKLAFRLPSGLQVHAVGMVARAYRRPGEHPLGVGMGVQFFVMSKDDRREWDRFCLELERKPHFREHVERTGVGPAPPAREPAVDARPEPASVPPAPTVTAPGEPAPRPAVEPDDDSLALAALEGLAGLAGLEELEDLQSDDEIEVPLPATGDVDDGDDLDVTFVADDIEVTVIYDDDDSDSAEPSPRISDEVSLDPGSPRTHTALGRVLLEQMEDAAAAVQALQRALECDPDHLEAHLLLRLAYALTGDRERALAHLRIARRLQAGPAPDDAAP